VVARKRQSKRAVFKNSIKLWKRVLMGGRFGCGAEVG
jgi:hypothetical protein